MEEVYCEFEYSRVAVAFLAIAVGTTLAIVTLVPFPDGVRALAFGLVIALATHAHRRLRGVRAVQLDCSRAISVQDRSGDWCSGCLRDGSFVSPWLTIVHWRPEGARLDRTLVILPDMLSADAMRRIRVILKWA